MTSFLSFLVSRLSCFHESPGQSVVYASESSIASPSGQAKTMKKEEKRKREEGEEERKIEAVMCDIRQRLVERFLARSDRRAFQRALEILEVVDECRNRLVAISSRR